MLKCAEILVSGRVQGVGFRAFVVQEAGRLRLTGWTKNLANGDVQTVAEGSMDALSEFYTSLQRGPMFAEVMRHRITWSEARGEFARFDVRW